MDKLGIKLSRKRKNRRARIVEAFARERFLLARDLNASQFLGDDDFENHRINKKHKKTTSGKFFTRDFFKNQNAQKITKIRIQNQNINIIQKTRDTLYNKKLSKTQKADAIAYYQNERRVKLNIDRIYIQKSAQKIVGDIDIARVYFKNNAKRDAYIVNNLKGAQKKEYMHELARIQYTQRAQKRKNSILGKICDNV